LHRQPIRQSRESIVGRKRNRDCTGSESDKEGKAY
jgi:hypothetical protein